MSSPTPTETPSELPPAIFSAPSSSSVNKRKYEEAITLLDDAAGTRALPATLERPPPPKRARVSLYSTLSKYGIGSSVDHKSSPLSNLQKVLKRAKQSTSDGDNGANMIVDAEDSEKKYASYDPDSRKDFLARLQSFKLVSYSSKPPQIDAVAAARCGWFNEEKERLVCKTCKAAWTMPPRPATNKEELASLVSQQQAMLISQHLTSCPWRVRQSEESIYSMPIPSPSALSASILQRASRLQPFLGNISTKHPLTIHQVGILVSATAAAQSDAIRKAAGGADKSLGMSFLPEETAIIVAFFGWDRHSPSSSSTTGTPSTPGPSLSHVSSGMATPSTSTSNRIMVTCQLCQRQVGLWSFIAAPNSALPSTPSFPRQQSGRQFDVLKEHRPHCPFVVKTTYLPTLSLPSKEARNMASGEDSQPLPFVEGWKALMSVVSRSQWRRNAGCVNTFGGTSNSVLDTPRSESGNDFSFEAVPNETDTDQVSEIVKDVKSRHGGGRDLLRFVKGLLG